MADLPDSAKRYMGFKSYEEAHAAWASYLSDGTLPVNVPAITHEIVDLARELRDNMVNLRAAQAAAVERLSPRPFSSSGPSASRRPTAVSPPTGQRIRRHDTLHSGPPNLLKTSSTGSVAQGLLHVESTPPGFWVVFAGFAPGVYPDRCGPLIPNSSPNKLTIFRASAEAEGNDLSNNEYAIVPTFSAATEMFTQYFMLRRVRYLPCRPGPPR